MAKFMICPAHNSHDLHAINLDHVEIIGLIHLPEVSEIVATLDHDEEPHVLFESADPAEAESRFYEIVAAASPEIVTTTPIRAEPLPPAPE